MIILFEDGPISHCNKLVFDNFGEKPFIVDAGMGVSENINAFYCIKEHEKTLPINTLVFTNSLLGLNNEYAWNDELGVPMIYIKQKDGRYARIDTLTDKALRKAHNIMKMYLAGKFKED